MGFQESMQFWVFQNPVITGTADIVKFTTNRVCSAISGTLIPKPANPASATVVVMDPLPLWKLAGSSCYFIRIAGVFGASAVAMGAYGAHAKFSKDEDEKLKLMFEAANKYHFINALALLGTPLCRFPGITGTLLVAGMVMFCGTCYYRSLTGDNSVRKITPIGGTLLIVGWLTMVL